MRLSVPALMLTCVAWAAGCASAPQPMVDPGYAAGACGPGRIAVLPPDVFVVLDQFGDNDPVQSAALGQAVTFETVRAVEGALRSRGYDVDLSARWDGIVGQDGSVLVNRDELGWLANGILQFANGNAGGGQGAIQVPQLIAPELAQKVGWATQSDALLYLNIKGVTTTDGKRAASVLAAVFIVAIVAAIVLIAIAGSKGGSSGPSRANSGGGGWRGQPVARATPPASGFRGSPAGGGFRGLPPGGGGRAATMPSGSAPRVASPAPSPGGGWRGGGTGRPLPPPAGAPVYRGGGGPNVGIGVVVPLGGPVHTHDGTVAHDDEVFAGDELYVAMTLVSSYDGRVLWHARHHIDVEADDPTQVQEMVQTFLGTLPARPGFAPPQAAPPR